MFDKKFMEASSKMNEFCKFFVIMIKKFQSEAQARYHNYALELSSKET